MPVDKTRLRLLEISRDHLKVARDHAAEGDFSMLRYLIDIAYEEADATLFNVNPRGSDTIPEKLAPPSDLDILEKLTGELVGLRIAMQVQASLLAYVSEGGDDQMRMSLDFALDSLRKSRIESGTLSTARIHTAAEHCLRQVYTNSKITL
jgi:hypothetical protein